MLYFIILAGYVALGLAALQRKGEAEEDIWYRMAEMLYEWLPHRRQSPKTERNNLLYLKKALLLLLAGDIAALALWTGQAMKKQSVGDFILRNAMGEGNRTEYFIVKGENGEETDAELLVRECRYTDAELEKLYEKLLAELETVALGENEAWDLVTEDLVFSETVEGYPFTLHWDSSDMGAVASDGRINATTEEQPVTVSLRASYFDFERETVFYIKVCPKGESFSEKVSRVLKEAEEENPYRQEVKLPAEADGEALIFTEKSEDKSGGIFLLGLAGALAVWCARNSGLQKKEKERQEKMKSEYPVVINKLRLYLGAGLNVKSAFRKIAEYGGENPIYEEMKITLREAEGGIGEAEGYKRFGKRSGLPEYIRLTTLLVQNLKKGNAALLLQLRQEGILAQEERAVYVKRKGEEAGTKLIFPMVLLLGMVMLLIMVPAFLSL